MIYVSRELFDADVIVPIGSFCGAVARDTICPAFCDESTCRYLAGLRPGEANSTINMINDNLGVFWQINTLVAPGGGLFDILVGQRRSVLVECLRRLEPVWSTKPTEPFPLVLVEMDGQSDNNWDEMGTALQIADRAVAADGAIALLTRMHANPPPDWAREGFSGKASPRDRDLTDLLSRRHVFLFSQLPPSQLEGTLIAPLESSDELERLINQYGRALLLRSAHQVNLR